MVVVVIEGSCFPDIFFIHFQSPFEPHTIMYIQTVNIVLVDESDGFVYLCTVYLIDRQFSLSSFFFFLISHLLLRGLI